MGREFSIDEARKLVHGQAVEVKVADGQYLPGTVQGYPKITPSAVYLDVLTSNEFRMKIHFSFIRKPQ